MKHTPCYVVRAIVCDSEKTDFITSISGDLCRVNSGTESCKIICESGIVPFMMNIDGAKFEEHRFNTTRDMLDSVIYPFLERLMTSSPSSFAYYKNLNISITKEVISKRKTPFVVISKSLKNKPVKLSFLVFYFSCSERFR